jgi:uncharacterized protein (DUF58 family)
MWRTIPSDSDDAGEEIVEHVSAGSEVSAVNLHVATRRYHFHGPLLLYLITTVVLVFGAINGQNNLLFWLFGLAVGGLIVSGVLSGAALMGLQIKRIAPLKAQAGEEFFIHYEIRYRGFLIPACALIVEEVNEQTRGVRTDFVERVNPGIGFVDRIEPRGSCTCFTTSAALKRGVVRLGAVRVSSTFPFGLTRKSVVFTGESSIVIRPRFIGVRFPSRGAGSERDGFIGARNSGREGEFFALREFARGDHPRDIAWRPSARVGMPLVRECTPPRVRRELIVLDAAPNAQGFDAIVSGAATLACEAYRRGTKFAIMTHHGFAVVSEGSGARHFAEALDRLAVLDDGAVGPSLKVSGARRTLVTGEEVASTESVVSVREFMNPADTGCASEPSPRGVVARLRDFVIGGEA